MTERTRERPSRLVGLTELWGEADHRCLEFDKLIISTGVERENQLRAAEESKLPKPGANGRSASKTTKGGGLSFSGKVGYDKYGNKLDP